MPTIPVSSYVKFREMNPSQKNTSCITPLSTTQNQISVNRQKNDSGGLSSYEPAENKFKIKKDLALMDMINMESLDTFISEKDQMPPLGLKKMKVRARPRSMHQRIQSANAVKRNRLILNNTVSND